MYPSRTMPFQPVIPVLHYPCITEAVDWLSEGFGFERRWQVAEHRAQLAVGPDAAIAISEGTVQPTEDHIMVRVADVVSHRIGARVHGALVGHIEKQAYGELQYTAWDHAGRRWVFSETVADLAPEDWGATGSPSTADLRDRRTT